MAEVLGMAIAAILGGSLIGTVGALTGWLFLGLAGHHALVVYLGFGLLLPVLFVTFVALRGRALSWLSPQKTAETKQHAHPA